MKRLLMIAYYFPPLAGGGVQRTLNFARALPALGWAPTLLCGPEDTAYWARDPTLLDGMPSEVNIVRVSENKAARGLLWTRRVFPSRLRPKTDRALWFPDRHIGWFPSAVRRGLRLFDETPFDAIYSTGGPWTDHVVGLALAQTSKRPWVSDFRDPWTTSPLARFATPLHARAHRALESEIYAKSTRVIINTPGALERATSAFPELEGKATAIPNGFREADFADLPAPLDDGLLRIGYAGTLYPGRGGRAWADLLRGALERRPELEQRIRFRLIGNVEGEAFVGLDPILELVPYQPHRDALEKLAECNALVTLDFETHGYSPFVPQKVYLYARLHRPIVALGDPGETDRVLKALTPAALRIRPDDVDPVTRFVEWIDDLNRTPWSVNRERLPEYEWSSLTARLAHVLDDVAD